MGAFEWHRMHTLPPVVDVLPTRFIEPPPGPKSPNTSGLTFEVGRLKLSDAEARLNGLGIRCTDTSPRALSEIARENKRVEMAEAEAKKARGEAVAAVTGASVLYHRSKMEGNPQVRLVCEDVDLSKLDGRVGRPPYAGRLLLIWDSPQLPLRHVSAAQPLPTLAEAQAAFDAAAKAMATRLDSPGEGKILSEMAPADFPLFAVAEHTWKYADFKATVKAQNLGHRGIEITESYEVPYPIRADAPTLPATAAKPPAPTP